MRIRPGVSLARRRERGIVLLLTLAVLFISIALVAQLAIGSSVAFVSMRNRADTTRMEWAARSAAEEALNLLRDDAAGGDGMSAMGSALGAGGFGGADPTGAVGGAAGAGGAAAGGDAAGAAAGDAPDTSNTDSYEDTWAKPMRIMLGDLEFTTFVQDENSKYNLHLLAIADPERRELEKERVVRILDAMREGFDDDVDETEARAITDDVIRWLDPRARSQDLPLAPRHSMGEDDSAEFALMGSLEELMLLEHVDENLFYDQVRRDEIAPGLQSLFTIWTTIDFEEASSGDLGDAAAAAAAAGTGGAAGAGDTGGAGGAAGAAGGGANAGGLLGDEEKIRGEGGLAGALSGGAPIGTKINLNTAPRAVIEGLMPEYRLPRRQTEEILRWRNEVNEEEMDRRDAEDVDADDQQLRTALFGEQEEDPKQIFLTLEDIRKVPGFEEGQLPPDVEQELTDLLGVQSDIFTVYLYARVKQDLNWEPEKRYQEMPGSVLRLRAVVWRRTGQDGPVLLFLQPWQPVPATRYRIPDFQDELPPFEPTRYQ